MSLLTRALDILSLRSPSLADRIARAQSEKLDLRRTSEGIAVASALHRESPLPSHPSLNDIIVIGGILSLNPARSPPPLSTVIIVEPEPSTARLALSFEDWSPWLSSPSVFLALDPADLSDAISQRYRLGSQLILVPPNPNTDPAAWTDIQNSAIEALRRTDGHVKILLERGPERAAHSIRNLPALGKFPSAGSLRGLLHGPVILVGPGPSLDRQLPFLKAAAPQIPIATLSSAYASLISSDIAPTLLLVLDSRSSRAFELDSLRHSRSTTAILHAAIPPVLMNGSYRRRYCLLEHEDPLARWLSARHPTLAPSTFPPLPPTSAALSFRLLRELGFHEVVLVGFDFAFTEGWLMSQTGKYAGGRLRIGTDGKPESITLPAGLTTSDRVIYPVRAADQSETWTSKSLLQDRELLEIEIAAARSVMHTFNATEGGLEISGAQTIRLSQYVADRAESVTLPALRELLESRYEVNEPDFETALNEERLKCHQIRQCALELSRRAAEALSSTPTSEARASLINSFESVREFFGPNNLISVLLAPAQLAIRLKPLPTTDVQTLEIERYREIGDAVAESASILQRLLG